MVSSRRLVAALAVALLGFPAITSRADAHPIHSTITELVLDPGRGTVRATIRVFADDLGSAVRRAAHGGALPPPGLAFDDAVLTYAAKVVSIRTARGDAVVLRGCGTRRSADLVWVCLEGQVARDAGPLQMRQTMLCELYEDQVNVVQGTIAGSRRSLLFVRGDRFKPL
jgi:hypothetical protein